jgi:hypothetical protein
MDKLTDNDIKGFSTMVRIAWYAVMAGVAYAQNGEIPHSEIRANADRVGDYAEERIRQVQKELEED